MYMQEPSVQMAAALIVHWENRDIEAVILLLQEIKSQAEAEDIITGLLLLHSRSLDDVHKVLARA